MRDFEYSDERISSREIMVAMPSVVIGAGVLSLPSDLASITIGSDGWISLAVSGMTAIALAWAIAKLASRFPQQSFMDYASHLVSKPVAVVMTFLLALISLQYTAFEVRQIADVAKQYLFDRTPLEVISLTFLLVVVYAVSGSREGLFRLNTMFLPIILLITVGVLLFNFGWFDFGNLQPIFQTGFTDLLRGAGSSVTSYIGFGILWFYVGLVKDPEKAPRAAAIGMSLPMLLYVLLFVMIVGVFGNAATANLLYPTVELAKTVDLPVGFFERFESIFFVIWIMAIFNTTVMVLDVAVLALHTLFKNTPKIKILLIVTPLTYLVSMYPQNLLEVSRFGEIISYTGVGLTVFLLILLSVMLKIRGGKP
ncbi:GerAB/ArcD/ProY family transporter [Lentibacillus sediminis]|uniref:GerAB/ArcD/ProY family transporter n=1 Tax=Lentibacillus sediminis TaxID=1940529 RepID=UPI000C1C2CF7|nr:endospore germination permease [Lentibacillus sediminis]